MIFICLPELALCTQHRSSARTNMATPSQPLIVCSSATRKNWRRVLLAIEPDHAFDTCRRKAVARFVEFGFLPEKQRGSFTACLSSHFTMRATDDATKTSLRASPFGDNQRRFESSGHFDLRYGTLQPYTDDKIEARGGLAGKGLGDDPASEEMLSWISPRPVLIPSLRPICSQLHHLAVADELG